MIPGLTSTLSDSLNIFTDDLPGAIKTESVSKRANNEAKIPNASLQTVGSFLKGDIGAYKEPCAAEDDSKHCDQLNFLVFKCMKKETCGGWGDRQKGIISTYLLSLLTNRTFALHFTSPCKLTEFLQPNSCTWTKCYNYILSVPQSKTKTINMMYNGKTSLSVIFQNSLETIDLKKPFKKNVVFIRTNQIWNEHILAHPKAKERIPWAVGKTIAEVSSLVLDRLFRPKAFLQKEMARFLSNVSHRQMVCSHIRVGRNPTIPLDDMLIKYGSPNVTYTLEFLHRFEDPSKYVIYVATDSEKVKNNVKKKFVNSITLDMPVIHVDRYGNVQDSVACSGLFTALLEQYILSRCDTFLLTRSNFGAMAAYMSLKVQDLFIYYPKNNSIFKIKTRNDIQKYHVHDCVILMYSFILIEKSLAIYFEDSQFRRNINF